MTDWRSTWAALDRSMVICLGHPDPVPAANDEITPRDAPWRGPALRVLRQAGEEDWPIGYLLDGQRFASRPGVLVVPDAPLTPPPTSRATQVSEYKGGLGLIRFVAAHRPTKVILVGASCGVSCLATAMRLSVEGHGVIVVREAIWAPPSEWAALEALASVPSRQGHGRLRLLSALRRPPSRPRLHLTVTQPDEQSGGSAPPRRGLDLVHAPANPDSAAAEAAFAGPH